MTTAPMPKEQGNQEVTKRNQPYVKPELDAFDSILRTADFGTRRSAEKILNQDLEELWEQKSEPVPAWLKPVTEKVELPQSPFNTVNWLDEEPVPIKVEIDEVECDLAVHIPICLRPSSHSMSNVKTDGLPDWMKEDQEQSGEEERLPEWLSPTYRNALKAKRSGLPDWMKEVDAGSTAPIWPDDEDVFNQNGLSNEAQEYIDPNETQEIKPVNRHELFEIQTDQLQPEMKPAKPTIRFINLDKHDKAIIAVIVICAYISAANIYGAYNESFVVNTVLDFIGISLYVYFSNKGYNVLNFLPRKQK